MLRSKVPVLPHGNCRSRLFSFSIASALAILFLSGLGMQWYRTSQAHVLAAYRVSGTVFDDYNQDGMQQEREPGINGVVATAYNAAGTAVTHDMTKTVGSAQGQYSLSIPGGTGMVRIQFSNFGASSTYAYLKGFEPSRHAGGATADFVHSTQTINFGLERSAQDCQNNPQQATSCSAGGKPSGSVSAPIEIGGRVWRGSKGNGTQDPGEPPIAGVTLHLYASGGTTPISTTTTNSSGAYSFSIKPYTSYIIKLDNPADYRGRGPLKGDSLTVAKQGTASHSAASKAVLPRPGSAIGSGNYPQIAVSAHTPGQNDYTFGIGFVIAPDLVSDVNIVLTNLGGSTFHVGDLVSYTLTVNNTGTTTLSPADTITVTDTVPTGLNGLSTTGTSSDWTVSLVGSTLSAIYAGPSISPAGAFATITLTGTLTRGALGTYTNTASVSIVPPDGTPSDNSSSDSITVVVPDVNIVLTNLGGSTFHVGDLVSYTLTVNNTGTTTLSSGDTITVTDTVPTGLSGLSTTGTSSDWTVSLVGSVLTATYATLAPPVLPGQPFSTITLTGTLTRGALGTYTNTASVSIVPPDGTPSDNSSSDSITVVAPDVNIVLTNLGGSTFHVGDTVSYTLTVSNVGTGPVPLGTTIVATDTIPAGLSNLLKSPDSSDWTITLSATTSPATLTATYRGGSIAAGATLTLITLSGTLTGAVLGTYRNTASVTVVPFDSNPENNTSSDSINVVAPDLSMLLSHTGGNSFHTGDTVSYTLTVNNVGTGPVLGPIGSDAIVVTDTIPAGLSGLLVTPVTPSDWTIVLDRTTSPATLTATYKTYPVAAGATLSLITLSGTLTSDAVPTFTNLVSVSVPFDSNPSNNSSSDSIFVDAPDLSMVLSNAGGSTFHVGDTVTYTLTVKNVGMGPVPSGHAITVTDVVPAGLSNLSANAVSEWAITLNGNTMTATYTGSYPVDPGTTLTPITLKGMLTSAAVSASFTNTASVNVPFGSNSSNSSSSDPITVIASSPTPTPIPTPTPSPTPVPGGPPGLPPTGSDPSIGTGFIPSAANEYDLVACALSEGRTGGFWRNILLCNSCDVSGLPLLSFFFCWA